ncbi:hybrid sensor histidine kinase/response regulator [Proteiniphilum sp.]|uniref:hybrid sensor histidine kinase/response regulator n=1 Tax=Proteiniphilum sp. TaxID=1926877 RepID=UPI002B21C2CA|nr:hybrid sensor histidine kinase/response regulator [Proteiniphilum sp.]MEA4915944.1 hybrid sensor histidine kinase/response regulator [Proteiniphilum sp.]
MDFSLYKILIVDDIPTNVWLLKSMLEQSGLQVCTAGNSEEALARLKTEPIDLILLDVLMPGVNGFELAEQLKSDLDFREIPIIFLTALNEPGDVVKGFHTGGNDFISKPFNKEELFVRIRHQLTLLETKRTIQRQTVELQKAIAGRDALYSVIAHDLRLPMSSLKITFNVLLLKMEEYQIGEQDIMEMLQTANETTEQLFSLLDNLLKWIRSQIGKLEAVHQSIYLGELAEGVVEIFSMVASTKRIKINFQSSPVEDTEVCVDIDMIKTAIRNLLSNAIKFSYNGSEIDVVVESKGAEVFFRVTDHGCGIKEEDQHKLLDAAIHYTTFGTEHESGSGLGLLLVNEFMKLNNGRLFFKSKEGEGSTFSFALAKKEG